MKDRVGNTLLHSAVASPYASALYTLLDLGGAELLESDIWSKKNANGETPRHLMHSPVDNQVLMYFRRSKKDGGKVTKYTVSGGRTQLLMFLSDDYYYDYDPLNHVLRASKRSEVLHDVDVQESSDLDFDSVKENIERTQSHGDSAGLIVIIVADFPPDTEAVLRLMCDETLSQKT